jgi:hypothetical protein
VVPADRAAALNIRTSEATKFLRGFFYVLNFLGVS